MNNSKDRSRSEIVMFIVLIFGVWVSIWAVILVNKWLELTSFILTLGCLIGFALRDTD
ncbi:MAG TPA: hypothetical protein VGO59_07245 [Verrucomicrobiae bacterium]|jgi:hypothetical protein